MVCALHSDLRPGLIVLPVFALGSGEHGQLGNGRTGEHIVTSSKSTFDAYSEPCEYHGMSYRPYISHPSASNH